MKWERTGGQWRQQFSTTTSAYNLFQGKLTQVSVLQIVTARCLTDSVYRVLPTQWAVSAVEECAHVCIHGTPEVHSHSGPNGHMYVYTHAGTHARTHAAGEIVQVQDVPRIVNRDTTKLRTTYNRVGAKIDKTRLKQLIWAVYAPPLLLSILDAISTVHSVKNAFAYHIKWTLGVFATVQMTVNGVASAHTPSTVFTAHLQHRHCTYWQDTRCWGPR